MLIEGLTGLLAYKRGRNTPGTAALSELASALLVQEAGGRYTELAWNGILYTLSSAAVATPAAGPLAAGGTPLLALWNPANSGFAAILTRIIVGWSKLGTTSGKAFELDGGATAAITQATVISGQANQVGAGPDSDLKGFSAAALTGSTVLARLRWLQSIGNGAADAFSAQPGAEDISGSVIVMPGTVVAVTAAALGVANEAVASIEYAKVKIT